MKESGRRTKIYTFVVIIAIILVALLGSIGTVLSSTGNQHTADENNISSTSRTRTTASQKYSSYVDDEILNDMQDESMAVVDNVGDVSYWRQLAADYKQTAPWQQDYDIDTVEDRRQYETYEEELKYNTCLSPIQGCTLFEIYNTTNRRCFWLNDTIPDFCPPTPKCDNSKIECVRIGTFCRNRFLCETIGGGGTQDVIDSCCINCQNLILENCPNWCNSGLPWQMRCDLYRYFANQARRNDNADTDNMQARFSVYKESLCVPKELGFRCGDTIGARAFCRGYISDSINNVTGDYPGIKEQCLNNCIRVVRDEDYCDCLDIPLPYGGMMQNGDR